MKIKKKIQEELESYSSEVKNVSYKYIKKKEAIIFEVINKKKPTPPKALFKYYALNEYSIDALTKGYIYASHPNQLNDVFDIHHNIIKFDDEDLNISFLKERMDYSDNDAKKNKDNQNLIAKNFKELLYHHIGVLSLTTKDSDVLMWSYYTNHKGFSIEFDYSKFDFTKHGPFPVNYQDPPVRPISIAKELHSSLSLALLVQSNIKHKDWKHENEWRFLIESPSKMISPPFNNCGHNRKFKYPIEAIKSITLGIRFFEFDKQIDHFNKVSDLEMHITINENLQQKSLILDFIEKNNIPATLINDTIIENNIFGVNKSSCFIKKISYNTYRFLHSNKPFNF